LQISSILHFTTVVTRDTFPVFSVTSGAATHTITATAFYACFKNRSSEPRISPASTCVPRVGFAPLCVLPPRFLTTAGFLSHLPQSRWQHCIAPTVMHHPALATLYCPRRDAPTVSPPWETPPRPLSLPLVSLYGKHHRDHCQCRCSFLIGDTIVVISAATKGHHPPILFIIIGVNFTRCGTRRVAEIGWRSTL